MEQKLVDFSAFHSRLRVTGTLHLETALRIGAGGGGGATEQDLPVVKDLAGKPYIPGSSFKGAYRAHLEALLRGMDEKLACLSTDTAARFGGPGAVSGCLSQGDVDKLKEENRDNPAELGQRILKASCWTCRLCGAPWLASKLMVRDMPVVADTWFDRYLIRDGVAIDRDTETVGAGLKFDYEAVPAGTAFRFEMVVDNATGVELGLALLGLREFEDGFVTLGGGRSRGLGEVKLEVDWENGKETWLVTRDGLRAYLLDRTMTSLADEEIRRSYWKAFLDEVAKGGKSDA
ncbi:MAG: CRISPR-associated RAMP protein [Anaerolineales bacterium]|nr:MAG: CRISPR-associated RAMP protein [Anaerolineales bacterium]